MNITHHKNGEIKTLVDEAPYHPGYEDAGFKPKEMNNEPVAWIAYDEFGDFMLEATPEGDYPWKPLYTHPAKTLTDEFIYKNHVGYLSPNNEFYAPDYPTWKQDGFTPIYKEPVAKTLTDGEIVKIFQTADFWYYSDLVHENDAIDFARAILKKASEK